MMGNFTTFLEEKLMPIATKFSTQRHLKAIRDAFICIMPITLAGGIVSVISATQVRTNPHKDNKIGNKLSNL